MFKLFKIIVLVVIIVIVIGIVYFFFAKDKEDVNVLFLGIESIEGNSYRSDTIMLLNFKLKKNKIYFVSVPRDTMVEYKGKRIKLNSLYDIYYKKNNHKKASLEVAKKIERILKISIPYYVQVDYNGVKEVVDLFNGVKIKIDEKMKYKDKAANLDINFEPGNKVLNGTDAVKYLRYRSKEKADIGRMERQQRFVLSLLEKIKMSLTISKIPAIYKIVTQYMNTNISLDKIALLFEKFKDFKLNDTGRYILPGEPFKTGDVSYWKLNFSKMEEIIKKIQ